MKVYIPSYNRAGEVITHKLFKECDYKIVIPISQESEYLKYYSKDELLVIPDNMDGSIGKKRNAILDIMKNEEGYGIIVDDDILGVKDIKSGEFLSSLEIKEVFENLFTIANDLNIHFVGLNCVGDKIKYRGEFYPFSLKKPCYWMVGIVEDGLRYDDTLIRGEDVDFYFQQMKKNRKILRDNRYFAVNKNDNKDTGIGLRDDKCIDSFRRLQKRYGKKLVRLNDDGTLKGVTSPIEGV